MLDERVREMLDHHEITQLIAEYCHGCDRCDTELMASTYWEDSWDNHGVSQAPGPEYARMTVPAIREETRTLSHHLGQSLIKVEGNEAGAQTYYLAVTLTNAPDGTPMCNQLGGRYVDRLERREGRWKVKERITVRDWSISLKVEHDIFALQELTPGRRSAQDPSYAVLKMTHSCT